MGFLILLAIGWVGSKFAGDEDQPKVSEQRYASPPPCTNEMTSPCTPTRGQEMEFEAYKNAMEARGMALLQIGRAMAYGSAIEGYTFSVVMAPGTQNADALAKSICDDTPRLSFVDSWVRVYAASQARRLGRDDRTAVGDVTVSNGIGTTYVNGELRQPNASNYTFYVIHNQQPLAECQITRQR
jgi:hypothetical protein